MTKPFKMNNSISFIDSFDRMFNESMKPLLLMDNSGKNYSKSVHTTSTIKGGIEKTTTTVTENGKTYTEEYNGVIRPQKKHNHTFF